MSAHELLTDENWDLDPIDGIHGLRSRRTTRLWYRALPPEIRPLPRRAVRLARRDAPFELAVAVDSTAFELAEIARLALEASRALELPATVPAAPVEAADAATWQTVPAECPSLMLAASPMLAGEMSEAHLGPGVQFRVLSADNGVSHVEVLTESGQIVAGYCNTVDLACFNTGSASRITTAMLLPKTGLLRLTQGFGAAR
jgi:hypothetical protein